MAPCHNDVINACLGTPPSCKFIGRTLLSMACPVMEPDTQLYVFSSEISSRLNVVCPVMELDT